MFGTDSALNAITVAFAVNPESGTAPLPMRKLQAARPPLSLSQGTSCSGPPRTLTDCCVE